jgi:hypothetical protein
MTGGSGWVDPFLARGVACRPSQGGCEAAGCRSPPADLCRTLLAAPLALEARDATITATSNFPRQGGDNRGATVRVVAEDAPQSEDEIGRR